MRIGDQILSSGKKSHHSSKQQQRSSNYYSNPNAQRIFSRANESSNQAQIIAAKMTSDSSTFYLLKSERNSSPKWEARSKLINSHKQLVIHYEQKSRAFLGSHANHQHLSISTSKNQPIKEQKQSDSATPVESENEQSIYHHKFHPKQFGLLSPSTKEDLKKEMNSRNRTIVESSSPPPEPAITKKICTSSAKNVQEQSIIMQQEVNTQHDILIEDKQVNLQNLPQIPQQKCFLLNQRSLTFIEDELISKQTTPQSQFLQNNKSRKSQTSNSKLNISLSGGSCTDLNTSQSPSHRGLHLTSSGTVLGKKALSRIPSILATENPNQAFDLASFPNPIGEEQRNLLHDIQYDNLNFQVTKLKKKHSGNQDRSTSKGASDDERTKILYKDKFTGFVFKQQQPQQANQQHFGIVNNLEKQRSNEHNTFTAEQKSKSNLSKINLSVGNSSNNNNGGLPSPSRVLNYNELTSMEQEVPMNQYQTQKSISKDRSPMRIEAQESSHAHIDITSGVQESLLEIRDDSYHPFQMEINSKENEQQEETSSSKQQLQDLTIIRQKSQQEQRENCLKPNNQLLISEEETLNNSLSQNNVIPSSGSINPLSSISSALIEQSKVVIDQQTAGDFSRGDRARRILSCRPKGNDIVMEIEWVTRPNGQTPLRSSISSRIIRLYHSDMVIDFYEQRVKFTLKNAEKKKLAIQQQQQLQQIELKQRNEQKEGDIATTFESHIQLGQNRLLISQEQKSEVKNEYITPTPKFED